MSRAKSEHIASESKALTSGRFPFSSDARALWQHLKAKSRAGATPPLTLEAIRATLFTERGRPWTKRRLLHARLQLWEFRVLDWDRHHGDRNKANVYTLAAPEEWGFRLGGRLFERRPGRAPVEHREEFDGANLHRRSERS